MFAGCLLQNLRKINPLISSHRTRSEKLEEFKKKPAFHNILNFTPFHTVITLHQPPYKEVFIFTFYSVVYTFLLLLEFALMVCRRQVIYNSNRNFFR